MKLLITGASGLLGRELVRLALERGWDVIATYNRHEIPVEHSKLKKVKIDISKTTFIEDLILRTRPDVIIHCAAYTDVDGCELNKEYAWKVNVEATRSIALASRVTHSHLVYVSSVTGDTPILVRRNGKVKLISIEELYKCREPWNYEVLTLTDDYKLKFERISLVTAHPAKEIYEIDYEGGGVVKASGNHSVYVFSDNGITTKAVSELKAGDLLVTCCRAIGENRKVPKFNIVKIAEERYRKYKRRSVKLRKYFLKKILKGFNKESIEVTKDLMWLFGVYLAEGHSSNTVKERRRRLHKITFTTTNKSLAQRIVNLIKNIFKVNVYVRERKDGSIQIEVNRYIVYKIFEEFGHTALDKKIPDWLWLCPRDYIESFLNGYIEDGTIKRNGEVAYYSINENLITQLVWLCRINGIPCRYHSVLQRNIKGAFQKEPRNVIVYELVIPYYVHARSSKNRPPSCLCLPTRILGIKVDNRNRKLGNTVSKEKALRLLNSSLADKIKIIKGDIGVARVKKVIKRGFEKPILLYDINVPGNPRFFGGNIPILLHNTDYVFDGMKGLYTEEDEVNPVNYYGYTKLKGEEFVKEYADKWCIARTSVLYGWGPEYKLNFATWLLNNLRNNRRVRIVTDQYASPTLNTNLAEILFDIAEKGLEGILHTAGATRVSRYEFALKLAEVFGLDKNLIKPSKMDEIPWKAKRPRDSSLNVNKARSVLSVKPLELNEALRMMRNNRSKNL